MSKPVFKVIFETLCVLVGWGLLISAIIILFKAEYVTAAVLFIGSVTAFLTHAISYKSAGRVL